MVDGVDELVDGVDEAGGPALSSARMEFRMFYWDTVVTNRASARSVLREGDAARLRRLAPEWDRRTTRMSETSRILI